MVNPQYLSSGTLAQARQAFLANTELPSITLQKFFSEKEYVQLSRAVSKASFKKNADKMHCSYSRAHMPPELKAALSDAAMKKCISTILKKEIKKIDGSVCQFQWKDYTLLNDETMEKPGIDIIIDFTAHWEGAAGGKIAYVDGTGDSTTIHASPNTLSITLRKEGVQKFVQYCNHYAGKQKRLLFLGMIE